MNERQVTIGRFVRSGAIAGAVSAFAFVVIHDLFISDIWYSVVPMLMAGAVCGLCIGWTFGLLFSPPSASGWLWYNAVYLVMFAGLGIVSVLVYEPVTTVAAVISANAPPGDLFRRAAPVTILFTLVMAAFLGVRYGRGWQHYGAILLTCTVLVLLLGLNVSAIGLVEVPSGSLYLIAELFGLIFALNVIFAGVFLAIERKSLLGT